MIDEWRSDETRAAAEDLKRRIKRTPEYALYMQRVMLALVERERGFIPMDVARKIRRKVGGAA